MEKLKNSRIREIAIAANRSSIDDACYGIGLELTNALLDGGNRLCIRHQRNALVKWKFV
jgi:hypothetical protein